MSVTSPAVQGGYEVANALGRLNADRPKLGERCAGSIPLSRTLRYFLHALDLHQQETRKTVEQIAHDIRRGRIELLFDGDRVVVVCR